MNTACASALPIRLERQASGTRERKGILKSALIALRDIAVSHILQSHVIIFLDENGFWQNCMHNKKSCQKPRTIVIIGSIAAYI